MAPASSKSNPPRSRKRVEIETGALKRARDGSAFTCCEVCNKDVPVVLIDMHSCSLDSKIRMNLEAQVVEKVSELKKPAKASIKKRKADGTAEKAKKEKKEKKVKDPSKPKRPPTAYFIFMDDFRKEYKQAHPDSKNVVEVSKEGGLKWKSMSEEEKKPYLDKAAELKAEFDKAKDNCNGDGDGDDEHVDAEDGNAEDVEEISDKDE